METSKFQYPTTFKMTIDPNACYSKLTCANYAPDSFNEFCELMQPYLNPFYRVEGLKDDHFCPLHWLNPDYKECHKEAEKIIELCFKGQKLNKLLLDKFVELSKESYRELCKVLIMTYIHINAEVRDS